MGQTAVIPAQIVDVAAKSLLGINTASADAAQTVSWSAASTGDVLTVQGDGTVAFAAPSGGITSLNGLTAATQTFAVGTTGTDIAFVSATGTHTLNIPDASATARGVVTTGTQRFLGIKYFDTADIRFGTGTNDHRISVFGNNFYIDNNAAGFTQFRTNSSTTNNLQLNASGGIQISGQVTLIGGGSHTLEQRSATNAQAFRVYNTFTSATSYERLSIGWSGNVCTLTTEKGSAGGTLRGLKIGDAATALVGFYGVTPVDQPDTIADPSGGGTVDAEARTAINALIDRLQELGLIA